MKTVVTSEALRASASTIANMLHNGYFRIYGAPPEWQSHIHSARGWGQFIAEPGKHVSRLLAEFRVDVNRAAHRRIVLRPMRATTLYQGMARYGKFYGKEGKTSLMTVSIGLKYSFPAALEFSTINFPKDHSITIERFEIDVHA